MSKYIIKNCPCYDHDYEECLNTFRDEYKKCYDCTDCVLKQIVELCKYYKKHSDCGRDCPSFGGFLNKLLNKLDIQEVE